MLWLDKKLQFPAVEYASPEGLLCAGGDLKPQRLLLAYCNGIFPWYSSDSPVLWWAPDPRAVLPLDAVHVPRRLARSLRLHPFAITVNQAFPSVIHYCATVHQTGEGWLVPEMIHAYIRLHRMGYAHSFEAWHDGQLVGGMYGVGLGRAFFGESMFHLESNASRAALLAAVAFFHMSGVTLFDCQQHTVNMATMGCRSIPRSDFMNRLHEAINPLEGEAAFAPWDTCFCWNGSSWEREKFEEND